MTLAENGKQMYYGEGNLFSLKLPKLRDLKLDR